MRPSIVPSKVTFQIRWRAPDEKATLHIRFIGDTPEEVESHLLHPLPLATRSFKPRMYTLTLSLRFGESIAYQYASVNGDDVTVNPSTRTVVVNGVEMIVDDGILGDSDATILGGIRYQDRSFLRSKSMLGVTFGKGSLEGRGSPIAAVSTSVDWASLDAAVMLRDGTIAQQMTLDQSDLVRVMTIRLFVPYATFHSDCLRIRLSNAAGDVVACAFLLMGSLATRTIGWWTLPLLNPVGCSLIGELVIGHLVVHPLSASSAEGKGSLDSVECQVFHPGGQGRGFALSGLNKPATLDHLVDEAWAAIPSSRPMSKNATTLSIGHRGVGSLKSHPRIFENTILSLLAAASRGAQFVEFDVQLTRDCIPVIHHDFQIDIKTAAMAKEEEGRRSRAHQASRVPDWHSPPDSPIPTGPIRMRICDLSLNEFKSLSRLDDQPSRKRKEEATDESHGRSLMRRTKSMTSVTEAIDVGIGSEVNSGYATLEEVMLRMPADLGFDVEIKYPTDFGIEPQYFERQFVADTILKVMRRHAGQRRIFFSSFDPDMCVILSLKQPSWPVFFLTTGGSDENDDPRRESLQGAISFASENAITGLVVKVNILLEDPGMEENVKRVKESGLMLLTYGELNMDAEIAVRQAKAGVDGVISDRVGRSTCFL